MTGILALCLCFQRWLFTFPQPNNQHLLLKGKNMAVLRFTLESSWSVTWKKASSVRVNSCKTFSKKKKHSRLAVCISFLFFVHPSSSLFAVFSFRGTRPGSSGPWNNQCPLQKQPYVSSSDLSWEFDCFKWISTAIPNSMCQTLRSYHTSHSPNTPITEEWSCEWKREKSAQCDLHFLGPVQSFDWVAFQKVKLTETRLTNHYCQSQTKVDLIKGLGSPLRKAYWKRIVASQPFVNTCLYHTRPQISESAVSASHFLQI